MSHKSEPHKSKPHIQVRPAEVAATAHTPPPLPERKDMPPREVPKAQRNDPRQGILPLPERSGDEAPC